MQDKDRKTTIERTGEKEKPYWPSGDRHTERKEMGRNSAINMAQLLRKGLLHPV
jgi:hypothetical protein